MNAPKEAKHLKESTFYNGCGPRKSLDERITFINENNNLASRIMKVGNRHRLYGKQDKDAVGQGSKFNASMLSRKSSLNQFQ